MKPPRNADVPVLKGRMPYRLGTTSFIIPADVLPNVEYLAPLVDDVEILFFESDEMSPLPDLATIQRLKDIADEHSLTYTIHMPLDAWLGHQDEKIRKASQGKCIRIIERTASVSPSAYIFHLLGDESQSPALWRPYIEESIDALLNYIPKEKTAIENLHYPFHHLDEIIFSRDLSVCIDAGHLTIHGYNIDSHLDKYSSQARVFHVHGENSNLDHRDLSQLEPALLRAFHEAAAANGPQCVFTIEVFSKNKLERSLNTLERLASK